VCGRYTNTAGVAELSEGLCLSVPAGEGTRRFNIAPTENVLAVIAPHGEPEARVLRWGLVSPWAKDLRGGAKLINARVETVAAKAPFRDLIGRAERRALQVADGYFEWLAPEHQRRGEPRQPFYFQVDGGALFAFAAVWTPAKIAGEWVHSVSMLTCPAASNRVAAAVHYRMPVILAEEEARRAWLDPGLDTQDALALCEPLPTSRLSARPANPAVNKPDPAGEGPQLLIAP
jgi:putative SOS response-associated peptidase YedK